MKFGIHMLKKSSYKKVIHQDMYLSYYILYDMGVKKSPKLKQQFQIFALKATLCNFKILPDPGREELVGRGPKWGDFALAAVQKFRQTTLAQRQKHWQWPKRRRRTKENKKTKRMANGNLFSFPTSPKKKTREASK